MSFTVWAYATDNAVHHDNDLQVDTVDDLRQAGRLARERVAGSNYDTSWAKIVDNERVGRMGDSGVMAIFRKTRSGQVHMLSVRVGFQEQLRA